MAYGNFPAMNERKEKNEWPRKIRVLRGAQTYEEFGQRVGYGWRTVWGWEHGEHQPSRRAQKKFQELRSVESETNPLYRMKELCDFEEVAHKLALEASDEVWSLFTKDVRTILRTANNLLHHVEAQDAARRTE
jgi:hypothetical protein